MKAADIWWKGLDKDIKVLAKSCHCCQANQSNPVHVDLAGPFLGHMFFVAVDAHSKWLEVEVMSTTSGKTIEVLTSMFAQHGLPGQLMSTVYVNRVQTVSERQSN